MSLPEIPYFRPSVGEAEVSAVSETLVSGWLTTGAKTREFETAFASAVGARHAVAVNSCTAALHLALAVHDIGPGDEVIVPTMTFAATAEVVTYLGAKLVLVDIDPQTMCIDTAALAAAITPMTKAVMPVHYGGQAADMNTVLELAKAHNIIVIEDAAHAFPSSYRGTPVGSLGDMTCFSFYANKTITTGEGGMLVTDDEDLASRARQLSLHGLDRTAWNRWETRASWDYDIVEPGFKYNMTDVAAAMGIVQLARAVEFAETRRSLALAYLEEFAGSPIEPIRVEHPEDSAWHLFAVQLPNRSARDSAVEALRSNNIGSSVHYRPLHLHSYYRGSFQADAFPVATAAFDRLLSLPLFPGLGAGDIPRIASICRMAST